MRGRRALVPALVVLLLLSGCATAPGTAAMERLAIDAADVIRIEVAKWAGAEHARDRMSDERLAEITRLCEAVESAEVVANAELAVYLNSGPEVTADALNVALEDLKAKKLALKAAQRETP